MLTICSGNIAFAQQIIKGRVVDSKSKEPLAFVNVTDESRTIGAITDIDGLFELKSDYPIVFLTLTYVGYQPGKHTVSGSGFQLIMMNKSAFDLKEVEILPGQNPAELIIKRVITNKSKNNPNSVKSYQYESYNKMYFTADLNKKKVDSLATVADSAKTDSSYIRAKKFLDKQHLFMMETVSENSFKYPDKYAELVLAQRVSGLKDPSFATLFLKQQTFLSLIHI